VLDKIVLAALTRLPPQAQFEDGTAALLAEAQEARELGELTEQGYDLLERSLRVRGLSNCARIITDRAAVEAGRSMNLRRVNTGVYPFWPGPMQLRYEVPDGVDAVEIAYSVRNREEDRLGARVLVKWGPEPVAFEYDLAALDDPGDSTGLSGQIREVTLVSGDWDLELDPPEIEDGQYRATLENLTPGETFHLALAGLSGNDVSAGSVRILPNKFTPPGEAEETEDDDAAPNDDDDRPVHGGAAVAGGCGCRHEGGGGRLLWLFALLVPRSRR
jgi:hypothetical protein